MWTSTADTYCSCDWQEAVVTNQDDVEDWGSAEQVVHDQPHLAETLTQHPAASQVVWDVYRDAEGTCNKHTVNLQLHDPRINILGYKYPDIHTVL